MYLHFTKARKMEMIIRIATEITILVHASNEKVGYHDV